MHRQDLFFQGRNMTVLVKVGKVFETNSTIGIKIIFHFYNIKTILKVDTSIPLRKGNVLV